MEKSSDPRDWQEYLEVLGYAPAPWGAEAPASLPAGTSAAATQAPLPSLGIQLLFIGEAADGSVPSDRFEGETGELFEKMVAAMGLPRSKIALWQIPRPKASATAASSREAFETQFESLKTRIDEASPSVIVTLGQFTSQLLLKSQQTLPELRGTLRTKDFLSDTGGNEIPVMATFHPAYLLREPSMKKAAWEDLKQVMKVLGGAVV